MNTSHGVLGYRGNYRLIVQCLTFNTTRFNIPTNTSLVPKHANLGANEKEGCIGDACYAYYNAFNGAMAYVINPNNFKETGGLGGPTGPRFQFFTDLLLYVCSCYVHVMFML